MNPLPWAAVAGFPGGPGPMRGQQPHQPPQPWPKQAGPKQAGQRREAGGTTLKRVAPQTHLDGRMVSLLTRSSQSPLGNCRWPQPPAIEGDIQLEHHLGWPVGKGGLLALDRLGALRARGSRR